MIIESGATNTDGKGNIREDTSDNISVNTIHETEQTIYKKIFLQYFSDKDIHSCNGLLG